MPKISCREHQAFFGICHHSAVTKLQQIYGQSPASFGNLWKFLSMLSIIPANTGKLRHSPTAYILQWIPAISGNPLSVCLMSVFAVHCLHLPETAGVFIITFACSCRRLPTSGGDYRHLQETISICRNMPEFARLTGPIICAGSCRRMSASADLLKTTGICLIIFASIT